MANFDLIVIGGGAAGLMASIEAAEKNLKVLLIEKSSKLGRKILISGGGRCNVTNNKYHSVKDFLSNYPRGNKFLINIFNQFSNQDLMKWFEKRGLKLKTEEDGRVFPITDDSESVLSVLIEAAKKANVKIYTSCEILSIQKQKELFEIKTLSLELQASNLLIASGSLNTTSHKWVSSFNHTVIEPRPSLVGYTSSSDFMKDLQGVTVKDVALDLCQESSSKKPIATERGAMVFTHFGISGPVVFKISSLASQFNTKNKFAEELILHINFFPDYSINDLRDFLKNKWKENAKKKVINSINGLVPSSLEKYIVHRVFPNQVKTLSEISNKEFEQLINYLSKFEVKITGIKAGGDEIVTAGGVSLKEIDAKTMQSKVVTGLYFAGEILDIDGFTGGFNLQSAWSTGWVVGNSVI